VKAVAFGRSCWRLVVNGVDARRKRTVSRIIATLTPQKKKKNISVISVGAAGSGQWRQRRAAAAPAHRKNAHSALHLKHLLLRAHSLLCCLYAFFSAASRRQAWRQARRSRINLDLQRDGQRAVKTAAAVPSLWDGRVSVRSWSRVGRIRRVTRHHDIRAFQRGDNDAASWTLAVLYREIAHGGARLAGRHSGDGLLRC